MTLPMLDVEVATIIVYPDPAWLLPLVAFVLVSHLLLANVEDSRTPHSRCVGRTESADRSGSVYVDGRALNSMR